jgi:putative Holliday junction resolvase
MVEELSIKKVVVGLPLGLDGSETEQTKKTRKFAQVLEKALLSGGLSIEVDFQDERLSSVEAERILQDKKLKDSERRAAIDRMAASILLRSYLESKL